MNYQAYIKKTSQEPVNHLVRWAAELLPKKARVLDIGSGAGKESSWLWNLGHKVIAIDPKEKPMHYRHYQFHHSKFENVESAYKFDLVICLLSLPFIKSEKEFIKQLKRSFGLVKPGGLYIGKFFGENDDWVKEKKVQGIALKNNDTPIMVNMLYYSIIQKYKPPIGISKPKHWHLIEYMFQFPKAGK